MGWDNPHVERDSIGRLWDRRALSDDEFFATLRDHFKIEASLDPQVRGAFTNCFEFPNQLRTALHYLAGRCDVRTNPPVDDGRGCVLGIVSNLNHFMWKHAVDTFPSLGLFDFYALSWELRTLKPDSFMYEHAVLCAISAYARHTKHRYYLKPHEVLVLDDSWENVQAAREYGIHAEQVSENGGYADVERVLIQYGVELPPADYYPHPGTPERQPRVIIPHNAPH